MGEQAIRAAFNEFVRKHGPPSPVRGVVMHPRDKAEFMHVHKVERVEGQSPIAIAGLEIRTNWLMPEGMIGWTNARGDIIGFQPITGHSVVLPAGGKTEGGNGA